MKRNLWSVLLLIGLVFMVSACGGKEETAEIRSTKQETAPAAEPSGEAEDGVALAKEILSTFDAAVKEAVALMEEKPAPADLKPGLENLIAGYEEKMREINIRYLALRDKDIAVFGDANRYLGQNRGRHVFERDQAFTEYLNYYRGQPEGEGVVELLSNKIIDMLDIAVAR
jgi:hypothetical protein